MNNIPLYFINNHLPSRVAKKCYHSNLAAGMGNPHCGCKQEHNFAHVNTKFTYKFVYLHMSCRKPYVNKKSFWRSVHFYPTYNFLRVEIEDGKSNYLSSHANLWINISIFYSTDDHYFIGITYVHIVKSSLTFQSCSYQS